MSDSNHSLSGKCIDFHTSRFCSHVGCPPAINASWITEATMFLHFLLSTSIMLNSRLGFLWFWPKLYNICILYFAICSIFRDHKEISDVTCFLSRLRASDFKYIYRTRSWIRLKTVQVFKLWAESVAIVTGMNKWTLLRVSCNGLSKMYLRQLWGPVNV